MDSDLLERITMFVGLDPPPGVTRIKIIAAISTES